MTLEISLSSSFLPPLSVEDSGREEGPLALPLQRSDHLHHSQEEVWLIKTQLHEPVRKKHTHKHTNADRGGKRTIMIQFPHHAAPWC